MVHTPDVTSPARAAAEAGRRGRRRAPVLVAALVTTVWASILSYAVVVAAVALVTSVGGGGLPVREVFRFGTAGWLLAHGVPLVTGGGRLDLAPLAVSALAAWRIVRAGVHTARAIGARRSRSPRDVALAAGAVALVYGVLGALAALAADGPGLQVSVPRAGLTLAVFGLVGGAVGGCAESGLGRRAVTALPAPLRDGLRTGLVAALLILGAGAATAGTAIAVSGGDAGEMYAAYHTGFAGQAGLTALCLAYAPDLAAWAAAYLVGPGFAVGTGTIVSAARVQLGALPAVPVLVGLPTSAVAGPAALLLGVPLAGGMTAGWLLARRRMREAADRDGPPPTWGGLLTAAGLAGPVAGLALGLFTWASAGSLGGNRLAVTGAVGWQVGLVAAAVVALGALMASAATFILIGVRRRP